MGQVRGNLEFHSGRVQRAGGLQCLEIRWKRRKEGDGEAGVGLARAREGVGFALMGPGFPSPELGQARGGWADVGP